MKTIKVSGMSCGHCVASVTKALEAIPGVTNVRVSLETASASYEETAPVDPKAVAEAIRKIGFVPGETL